ncbi:MAG: BamA/TamA family outer membrane protein [Planctomycetota bacterium]
MGELPLLHSVRRRRRPWCGALLLCAVATGLRAQGEVERFDPYRNLGPDGTTVLKPTLPEDLPNPARWRYTPGGRILPGNIFERFLVSSFVAPVFFREEDIGVGGGIAVTDLDFRNQGWRELVNAVATASEEGQQRYRITWRRWLEHRAIPEGGIIRDERSTLTAGVEYSRTLTRRFYGFGSRTGEGDETSYTEELTALALQLRRSVPLPGDDLLLGFRVGFEHHGLQRGRVSDVPSSDDLFPSVFADGDGVSQLWLAASAAIDTRDSIANPYSGWRLGAGIAGVPVQSDLDAGAVISVDASGAIQVPPLFHDGGAADEDHPPTDVIAFGGFVSSTTGDLPWYSLPSLGGDDTLRGYIQRRFTDRVAAHGSVEYRFAIVPRGVRFTDTLRIERIGMALFYDFGTVSSRLGNLDRAAYLDSYGLGLRIGFQREALFRVDLGFSEEDRLLTVSFGNAF